tara:strand:+ start:442 stop:741 length:300 start_codon:yes stop_codon:yes gene_type:complete
MTTISPNFTALSADRKTLVGCHNLSSAIAIAQGRAPVKEICEKTGNVQVAAYRSPSGQYYVKTKDESGTRIDCSNQATARHYLHNGVPASVVALYTTID